jgi:hypothetical protein
MCALAQTQDKRPSNPLVFDSIRILSLQTGFYPYHLDGDETWGLAQWAACLVSLLMNGVNEVADFQTAQMMDSGAYCRVTLRLERTSLDDPSELGVLQRIVNAVDIKAATDFVADGRARC